MTEAVKVYQHKKDCSDALKCMVCKGWVAWPSMHRHLTEEHPKEYKQAMERTKAIVQQPISSQSNRGGLL